MSPPLLTYTHPVRAGSVPSFLGNPIPPRRPPGTSPLATLWTSEAKKYKFLSKALHFDLTVKVPPRGQGWRLACFCFSGIAEVCIEKGGQRRLCCFWPSDRV